jgi:hypothetical protein
LEDETRNKIVLSIDAAAEAVSLAQAELAAFRIVVEHCKRKSGDA